MENLARIKQEYDQFYASLMNNGLLPMRDTSIGFWFSSLTSDIIELFKKIRLGQYNYFLDIGSGDGKVTLIASTFCSKCFGVEYDPILIEKSREMQNKFGIKNARFLHKNLHDVDFRGFDILFCYPDQPMERGLEQKLLNELNGKLIVYGPHFHPTRLKKIDSFYAGTTFVAVYVREKP